MIDKSWKAKREAARARRDELMRDQPLGLCQCGCGEETTIAPATTVRYGYVVREPRLYVKGHSARTQSEGPDYIVEDRGFATPCWIWQKSRTGSNGYGNAWRAGRLIGAHKWNYEQKYGPVPKGLELDHLCRVPVCCNPDHLEAVTKATNSRRGLNTKLTLEGARHIRKSHESALSLAETYGVTRETIYNIRKGKSWVAT